MRRAQGWGVMGWKVLIWVWMVCAAGWSAPAEGAPDGSRSAKLRKAEELKRRYERLYEQEKHGEAIPLAEKACSILETELGEQSTSVAGCLNDLGKLYSQQRNHDTAELLLERALTIREKALGPEHPDVAESLNDLALLHQRRLEYGRAEPLLDRALAIREKALGPEHPDVAESLNNLALLYQLRFEYHEAEPLYERALAIREKALGPEHLDVAESLNGLALLYQGHEKAGPLLERALAIRENALGSKHPDVAVSLNNLALHYYEHGQYRSAKPLYERALAIQEKVLGPEHPFVATNLNNQALLLWAQGNYKKAKPLFERALAIQEKALGPEHPDVALSLRNLATLHYSQGEYGKVWPLYERALAIREKALGSEHSFVAVDLNTLAMLYYEQRKYREAKPLLERALAIQEKALDPEHPLVVPSLYNLAQLYQAQGDYGKAEPLFERALAIDEKALSPDHPRVATTLDKLAALHLELGEYEKAEPLLERALSIREKALGSDHPDIANSLNILGGLYWRQGDSRAQALLERALAIQERSLDPEHPDVADVLNNLASLYRDQGKHEKAKLLLERALAIQEKALGSEDPSVANTLNHLAMDYLAQGEIRKAELFLWRALEIRERVLGPEHPDVAYSLAGLALLYWGQGDYDAVEPLLEEALDIREKALGPEHLLVGGNVSDLGRLHTQLGRHDSAAELFRRALDIEEKSLTQTLVFAEEHRRLAFAATLYDSIDIVLASHLQAAPNHRPSAELALTTLLRRKGRVLDLVTRSTDAIRRSLPEEHRHLLDDLSRTRDRYARLTARGRDSLSTEAFAEKLAEIQREQHLLWRELSKQSPVVDALSKPVTIAEMQSALPPGAALVELIRYRERSSSSSTGEPRYAAYLILPDRFDWVDLGPADSIDQYAKEFRRALQLKQSTPTDLHDAVMQPIAARLGDGIRRLFIAPDGALNLVPFAALYDGEHYLVERYTLHYLATGRDLLRPWDTTGTSANDTVVIVANPSGANLPGTQREAALLDDLFPHVQTLLGETATETGVRRQTQPWVMHLATHGFFSEPEPKFGLETEMTEYLRSTTPSALQFSTGRPDNPMLHSGLVLTPTDTAVDGRLTAYEISGWDLRGTELVVLSACGTGLGETRDGEGVFGLRRAFAMAGAQTQAMSLWNVPDSTTAMLMEAYYRKLLEGKGRAEAMQEVQLEMLRSKEHHLPGDWASFVVVGEWRPLSAERLPERPPPVETKRGCRASIAGVDQPPSLLLLGLLALLKTRRSRHSARVSTDTRHIERRV